MHLNDVFRLNVLNRHTLRPLIMVFRRSFPFGAVWISKKADSFSQFPQKKAHTIDKANQDHSPHSIPEDRDLSP